MDEMSAEDLARLFHEHYERLAPEHGYETRKASAVPWEDVPENNRRLMIATCAKVLGELEIPWRSKAMAYADRLNDIGSHAVMGRDHDDRHDDPLFQRILDLAKKEQEPHVWEAFQGGRRLTVPGGWIYLLPGQSPIKVDRPPMEMVGDFVEQFGQLITRMPEMMRGAPQAESPAARAVFPVDPAWVIPQPAALASRADRLVELPLHAMPLPTALVVLDGSQEPREGHRPPLVVHEPVRLVWRSLPVPYEAVRLIGFVIEGDNGSASVVVDDLSVCGGFNLLKEEGVGFVGMDCGPVEHRILKQPVLTSELWRIPEVRAPQMIELRMLVVEGSKESLTEPCEIRAVSALIEPLS